MKDKKVTKSELLFELIILIIMLFSGSTLVYSWTHNTKINTSMIVEVTSKDATGFKISFDEQIYKINTTFEIPSNVVLSPISGNGKTFYKPMIEAGEEKPNESTEWIEVKYDENASSNCLFKKTIYLRAIAPGYIKLNSLIVKPTASGSALKSTTLSDVVRPVTNGLYLKLDNSDGYYSKDYIAASTRVYLRTSEEGINDILYIPMDSCSINLVDSEGETKKIVVDEEATPISLEECAFYTGSEIDHYSSLSGVSFYSDSSDISNLPITELKSNNKVGVEELYESSIDLYLWMEGFDNEALSAFSGGSISIEIIFSFEAIKSSGN